MKEDIIKKFLIDKRNKMIFNCHKEGLNLPQIATIFNISHTTVMRILKNYV